MLFSHLALYLIMLSVTWDWRVWSKNLFIKANKRSALMGKQLSQQALWLKSRRMLVWRNGGRVPGVRKLYAPVMLEEQGSPSIWLHFIPHCFREALHWFLGNSSLPWSLGVRCFCCCYLTLYSYLPSSLCLNCSMDFFCLIPQNIIFLLWDLRLVLKL